MSVFFEESVNNGVRTLNKEESRHCSQVLRHQIGDEIMILDGLGSRHHAALTQVSKKECVFEVLRTETEPTRAISLHLAISPTKSTDRMEWMVEKLCEIGIEEITFLKCKHSERKQLRLDRLEKKLVSAVKQSKNPFKPQLNEMIDFADFVQSHSEGAKFIAHVDRDHSLLQKQDVKENHITLLVGPEGDFSADEVNQAKTAGYTPVSLGSNVLRTETAGLVACCMIDSLNQR